jgi:hypothetical protein
MRALMRLLTVVSCEPMSDYCDKHDEPVKLVVVKFCPVCRGAKGGTNASESMTKAEKTARAKKAARARWAKKGR